LNKLLVQGSRLKLLEPHKLLFGGSTLAAPLADAARLVASGVLLLRWNVMRCYLKFCSSMWFSLVELQCRKKCAWSM